MSALKALMKHKKFPLRLLKGAIKILPELLTFFLLGKIKKVFLSEKQLFNGYLKKVKKLNQFNI